MAQGEGPEFKPWYCKKRETKKRNFSTELGVAKYFLTKTKACKGIHPNSHDHSTLLAIVSRMKHGNGTSLQLLLV
jgi:hypothetical protein